MKLAVLNDVHFGARNDSVYFNRKLNEYLHKEFIQYIIREEIKTLLLLGDIFDRRRYINFITLSEVRNFFRRLEEFGVKVYSILGNHDVYFKSHNDLNSQDLLLRQFSNVEIIQDKKVIDFDGCSIGMVSWLCPQTKADKINWISTCPAQILCGHFEVSEFSHICGHNYSTGLNRSIFNRFDFVLSGHHHIRSDDGQFFYLGTPIQFDWGDFNNIKGFHVIDTRKVTHTFIPNPDLIFHQIRYDPEMDLLMFPYEDYKDKIVKVLMPNYESVNKQKMTLFVDRLDIMAYRTELVWPTNLEMIDDDVFDKDVETGNTKGVIKTYIEEYVNSDKLDKDWLVEYSFDLYNEALERVVV